jgi:hypothetical protein
MSHCLQGVSVLEGLISSAELGICKGGLCVLLIHLPVTMNEDGECQSSMSTCFSRTTLTN